MTQENRSDPWDEVEGIPPLVKMIYRTPPGEERSWRTTLLEVEGLVSWLSEQMQRLRLSIDPAFDEQFHDIVMKLGAGGQFEMGLYIEEKINQRAEECLAVHDLLLRLFQKLRRELMDALS